MTPPTPRPADDGRPGAPRGRLPLGLLGMLALVAAVEGHVWRHAPELSDYASLAWKDAGASARGPEVRRADVLCLGDSLVKVGVLPRILEARLGRPAYNLAVYGGQAPSSYFLLRRALDAGARPRAVVVDFHPNLLAVAPKSSRDWWPGLLDIRDGLDLGRTTGDLDLGLAVAGIWLVPSARDRFGIRKAVLAALNGEASASTVELQALRRNWSRNAGAHVVAARQKANHLPVDEVGIDAAGQGGAGRLLWTPNRSNAAYVRRLFALAAARGIAVVWVLPPTTPAWQARRERIGADARLGDFIRGMAREYPGVTIVDGRHAGYGPTAFADQTHLNRGGAAEFSEALADLLTPRLAGAAAAGPVALPAFRGRIDGVPLEDIEQSRAALLQPADARRL